MEKVSEIPQNLKSEGVTETLRELLIVAREEPEQWFDVTEECKELFGTGPNARNVLIITTYRAAGMMVAEITTRGGKVHLRWRKNHAGG